ncbi:MAG: thioesterase domain-containing protein [Planctomycetota bacterium]
MAKRPSFDDNTNGTNETERDGATRESTVMDGESGSGWFRKLISCDMRVATHRLLWFTHAGGGYAALARAIRNQSPDVHSRIIPASAELWACVLPGRESRFNEAPISSMESCLRDINAAIATPPMPLVLIGHSLGAAIAYCLADRLRQRHVEVDGLIVMAMRSPDLINPDHELVKQSDADFVVSMNEQYGGIPDAIMENTEAQRLFVPTLRSDMSLLNQFFDVQPRTELQIPIRALRGIDDTAISRECMLGWRSTTSGDFSLRSLPGDHFFPLAQLSRVLQLATQW